MVATSNPLAVEAALWALGEGGTAMDAALASDAVLGVVQPMSTGVGGDVFCLVDDGREVVGFNGSGASPRALTLDLCRQPGAWSDRSPLCVTVPGVVDGWAQLGERYGRLGLERTTAPARQIAAGGFPLGAAASATWRAEDKRMRDESPLPRRPGAGQRVVNADLAATLDEIAGGLTEHECAELVKTIKEIHATGTTIVWIEHIVHALVSVASRLVVMNFGQVLAQGDPREVMANARVREVYMGIPVS